MPCCISLYKSHCVLSLPLIIPLMGQVPFQWGEIKWKCIKSFHTIEWEEKRSANGPRRSNYLYQSKALEDRKWDGGGDPPGTQTEPLRWDNRILPEQRAGTGRWWVAHPDAVIFKERHQGSDWTLWLREHRSDLLTQNKRDSERRR